MHDELPMEGKLATLVESMMEEDGQSSFGPNIYGEQIVV